jgi:DNA-binding transcriptional ArsR family regulator
MDEANKLANLSAQLADPARAAIVLSLMDGSLKPTGELQISVGLSSSSASVHLSKLVNSRVLTVAKQGRTKYYRIATAAVAHAVEALSIVASPGVAIQIAASSRLNPFAFARTCYDHLAGKLGVEIAAAMECRRFIQPSGKNFKVTPSGSAWLSDLGLDLKESQSGRRVFATQCLDFTERRYHLAGALGAALLQRMIELGWIVKSGVPRAVRLTDRGKAELGRRLNLEFTRDHNVKLKAY